jgi:hypothetical protein
MSELTETPTLNQDILEPLPGNGRSVQKTISQMEDESLIDYLTKMSGGASVQLKINRVSPRTYKGHQVSGLLETTDELLPEEEIKARHGGGKFEVKLLKKAANGKWIFAGQRTFEIAGPPKIDEFEEMGGGSNTPVTPAYPGGEGDPSLQRHALVLAERIANQERQEKMRLQDQLWEQVEEEADKRQPIVDPELLRTLTEPLKSQIENQSETIASLNEQLVKIMNRPTDTSKDDLIHKMMATEGDRIQGVRIQHESELRALRQSHQDDIKRVEDRMDRMIDSLQKTHDREVNNIQRSNASELSNLKLSYETRISSEQSEVRRLSAEISELKAELRALREKKEKPPIETLREMREYHETLQELMDDGKEDVEEKTGIGEKILEKVSPILSGIGDRLGGGGGGITPQQMAMIQAQQMRQQQAQAQATQTVQTPAIPQVSPSEVEQLTKYIEACITNNVDPAEFVKNNLSFVPPDAIKAIKQVGFDKWLESVAKISDTSNSPIATLKGKNWLRAVQKALTTLSPG